MAYTVNTNFSISQALYLSDQLFIHVPGLALIKKKKNKNKPPPKDVVHTHANINKVKVIG